MPNGDYEQRRGNDGAVLITGNCAACGEPIEDRYPVEGQPDATDVVAFFVVRYSADGTPGGIFHSHCAPTGPQWYGVGEEAGDTE